jgi:hypothetical protein
MDRSREYEHGTFTEEGGGGINFLFNNETESTQKVFECIRPEDRQGLGSLSKEASACPRDNNKSLPLSWIHPMMTSRNLNQSSLILRCTGHLGNELLSACGSWFLLSGVFICCVSEIGDAVPELASSVRSECP